jgi:hypothetical protein
MLPRSTDLSSHGAAQVAKPAKIAPSNAAPKRPHPASHAANFPSRAPALGHRWIAARWTSGPNAPLGGVRSPRRYATALGNRHEASALQRDRESLKGDVSPAASGTAIVDPIEDVYLPMIQRGVECHTRDCDRRSRSTRPHAVGKPGGRLPPATGSISPGKPDAAPPNLLGVSPSYSLILRARERRERLARRSASALWLRSFRLGKALPIRCSCRTRRWSCWRW